MRCRNEVAVMFHGDFHIKSQWCPNAMSQSGRSCVPWQLSDKSRIHVALRCRNKIAVVSLDDFQIMSHSCRNATSHWGRRRVALRCHLAIYLRPMCDVAARSHSCPLATFILRRRCDIHFLLGNLYSPFGAQILTPRKLYCVLFFIPLMY